MGNRPFLQVEPFQGTGAQKLTHKRFRPEASSPDRLLRIITEVGFLVNNYDTVSNRGGMKGGGRQGWRRGFR